MAYDDDVSGFMGSNYLTAAELPLNTRYRAVIANAVKEEVGPERKIKVVISLASAGGQPWKKPIVMNKGGIGALVPAFGTRLTPWTGCRVEVWAELVEFGPKRVPGFKFAPIVPPSAGSLPAPAPVPPSSPAGNGTAQAAAAPTVLIDDEIPF